MRRERPGTLTAVERAALVLARSRDRYASRRRFDAQVAFEERPVQHDARVCRIFRCSPDNA